MVNPYQPPENTPRYASFPKRFVRSCRLAGGEFRRGMKRDGLSWIQILFNLAALSAVLFTFGSLLVFAAVGIIKSIASGR